MSIEIRNLTHVYAKDTAFEKRALDNISFTINTGEFFGIIGHTGSGKSTLIQHFNSLLKPDSGEILIDGQNINTNKESIKISRQKAGLVFQYPEHQLFETTVFKDVAFGPSNMKLPQEEVSRRVKKALKLVGIEENLYEKSPFDLSGGQKRRVAIAGVLSMEPDILILDEPTAGLDPKGREEILGSISALHKSLNNTVIIVSHTMEDIAKYTDRLAVLDKGRLKYIGSPQEVFRNAEELEKIGLAAPQISYLIKKLNHQGSHLSEDIYTVEEAAEAIMKEIQ